MRSILPGDIPVPQLHQYLLGSVSPRPICFASTVDKEGNRNLAPFSFFNVFSANPPVAVFSPARSGRTGETKNTYDNCKEVAEVVINLVSYNMVEQMSLASSPYAKGVDEFVKAGLTPVDSDLVKPARVKESPVQLECKVLEIKELGQNGGAGNLIICEVVKLHIDEEVITENNRIDPFKIDLVARMGGNYYCRANGDAIFEIPKPITAIGVGIDSLPEAIRTSDRLTGNDLGKLGQLERLPEASELEKTPTMSFDMAIDTAKTLLADNQTQEALNLLVKNA
ncbi:MAG: flavin reductase family protein [Bacteroidia bacterium]|nr:flavin reductase family protein [Bacteroidia bacterium]